MRELVFFTGRTFRKSNDRRYSAKNIKVGDGGSVYRF